MNFKRWLVGSSRPTPQEIKAEVDEILQLANGFRTPAEVKAYLAKELANLRHLAITGSERGWEKEDYEKEIDLLQSKMHSLKFI